MKKCLACLGLVMTAVLFTACSPDKGNGTVSDNSLSDNTPGLSSYAGNAEIDGEDGLVLSDRSGFYPGEFELTVSINRAVMDPPENAVIWYTEDGSDPLTSETRLQYTGPITVKDRRNDENVCAAVEPGLITVDHETVSEDGVTVINTAEIPGKEDVDKCSVLRMACVGEDGRIYDEKNEVYFMGSADEHIKGISDSCSYAVSDLAIVSIQMDYDDLFDHEKGIYVKGAVFDSEVEEFYENGGTPEEMVNSYRSHWYANYNQRGKDWERPAAVTVITASPMGTSEILLSQNCGIRIQGQQGRSALQKSFRIYARKQYGKKSFDYPIFGESYESVSGNVMDSFDKLIIKSDYNGLYKNTKCADMLLQDMISDWDMENVAFQESRCCIVYLNGEYWGLYGIRTDFDDEWFASRYGVDKDNVILYKDKDGTEGKLDVGELPEGVSDQYYYFNDLKEFFASHEDLKSDEDFNEFSKLVDTDSFLNYFAAEVWVNNNDWPYHNWSMWRTIEDEGSEYGDGRWRMALYDLDYCGGYADRDTIADAMVSDGIEGGLLDTSVPWMAPKCFAYLMTNDGFREAYKEKLIEMSADLFTEENVEYYFDKYKGTYSPLWEQQYNRFPSEGSAEEADEQITKLKWFMLDRPAYVWPMQDRL